MDYTTNFEHRWLDYCGQKRIVINNFDFTQYPIESLLQDLDGWRYRVLTRGGIAEAQWTSFFIISPKSPEKWYPRSKRECYDALVRRMPCTNWHTFENTEDVRKFQKWWQENSAEEKQNRQPQPRPTTNQQIGRLAQMIERMSIGGD
jgi:hypothetical protein